jgi:hypothetical protein
VIKPAPANERCDLQPALVAAKAEAVVRADSQAEARLDGQTTEAQIDDPAGEKAVADLSLANGQSGILSSLTLLHVLSASQVPIIVGRPG